MSICISKEIGAEPGKFASTIGIDRNLRNLTVGNDEKVTYYDMTKVVEIAENTRSVVRSFKRDDVRIRRLTSSKYGARRSERVRQIIHGVTKQIVRETKAKGQAIVFEEIRGIRNLYRNGNGQGRSFRSRMNSWPFHVVKRQVEYKAAWEGVPVVTLSRRDTRGTKMDCRRCGERLQSPVRGDQEHRQLWCGKCERWMDRDLVAVLNISRRGRVRFARSSSTECEAGEAGEGERGIRRGAANPQSRCLEAAPCTEDAVEPLGQLLSADGRSVRGPFPRLSPDSGPLFLAPRLVANVKVRLHIVSLQLFVPVEALATRIADVFWRFQRILVERRKPRAASR